MSVEIEGVFSKIGEVSSRIVCIGFVTSCELAAIVAVVVDMMSNCCPQDGLYCACGDDCEK